MSFLKKQLWQEISFSLYEVIKLRSIIDVISDVLCATGCESGTFFSRNWKNASIV